MLEIKNVLIVGPLKGKVPLVSVGVNLATSIDVLGLWLSTGCHLRRYRGIVHASITVLPVFGQVTHPLKRR